MFRAMEYICTYVCMYTLTCVSKLTYVRMYIWFTWYFEENFRGVCAHFASVCISSLRTSIALWAVESSLCLPWCAQLCTHVTRHWATVAVCNGAHLMVLSHQTQLVWSLITCVVNRPCCIIARTAEQWCYEYHWHSWGVFPYPSLVVSWQVMEAKPFWLYSGGLLFCEPKFPKWNPGRQVLMYLFTSDRHIRRQSTWQKLKFS